MKAVQGKTAFITGGASGIGLGIAGAFAVNLGGVINGLQTFLPGIRAHGEGGHIINTASLAALVPMPAQYVIYQTAKAAVVTLSEAIRGELAQEGIGVSVLCPGPIRTNIHELSKNRPAKFGVGDAFRANESAGGTQVRENT